MWRLKLLASKLRDLLLPGRVDREMSREMAAHLAMLEDEYRRRGMSEDAASLAATRRFGALERARDQHREARSFAWLDQMRQDLRYTLRTLATNKSYTGVAVLTLALGIGAVTAVYSSVDAAFFRPLPFDEPERLVRLSNVQVPLDTSGLVRLGDGPPPQKVRLDVGDLDTQRDVFSSVTGYATGNRNLGSGDQPLRAITTFVTGEFFSTFRREAALGRTFAPDETRPGGSNVVVLSDQLWRGHFGADSAVIGTEIVLDDVGYIVVGVMPADFQFPAQTQLWVPLPMPAPFSIMSAFPNYFPTVVIARLNDGVTLDAARSRLDALGEELLATPQTDGGASTPNPISPLQRHLVGNSGTTFAVLMVSTVLVLLIACANAATLLLARAMTRGREIATHLALGATRGRVIRRLLVESVITALASAVLGLLIAAAGASILGALTPPGLAGLAPPELDRRVLAFLLVVAVATGLLFGMWPAFGTSRVRPDEAFQNSGGRTFARSGQANRILVVVQVGLACLLMIGSALLLESLRTLLATDIGMQVEGVATAKVSLPDESYGEAASRARFVEGLVTTLADTPNVASAAAVNALPFDPEGVVSFRVDAPSTMVIPPLERPFAPYRVVSPGYFRTVGIELVSGRDIAWSDGRSEPVAVINRILAERLWPGQEAIGQSLEFLGPRTVIGVVENARIFLDPSFAAGPQVYIPIVERSENAIAIVARGPDRADPGALIALIRDRVRSIDPRLPIYNAQPLEAMAATAVAPRRLVSFLIGAFGTLAFLLATIGIYALLSYSVTQRTREIGIRVALGAQPRNLIAFVLRQGMTLVAIGIALGLVGAVVATQFLETMLYGVSPRDPQTFLGVVLLFAAVAAIASIVPARRAARSDPLSALRHE